ncbi:MAG: glycoside hydrolase family 15 protein [Egibacteraceae bacterium]
MRPRIADAVAGEILRHDGPKPDNGLWEFRDHRPFVSSDIGRWMALDRAIWLARGWRPLARRGHWKRVRHEVRERVLGAIDGEGGLPQAYAQSPPCADGSALMAVMMMMSS